ncbi:lipopolysaccharide biosynthesis protein [Pantoea sp. FN0305]|uniref:lipopolysaccharide biosynthesis protein n=1 Tax=Pantoea sp. FN0305 TaxID=3418559 RepID=UPI003CF41AE1
MSLFKKSSVYLLSNIISALAPFLLLPVLTRYLSTKEYGEVAIFQTLVTGLAAFIGINTVGAAARRFFDEGDTDEIKKFNNACLVILFFSALFTVSFFFVFQRQTVNFFSIPEQWILVGILVASLNYIIQFRLNQWQIRDLPIKYGLLQVGQSIFLVLLTIILVIYFNKGAQGRVDALMLTTSLFAFFSLYFLFNDKLISINIPVKKNISEALLFGLPLVPHVFGMFLVSSIDRFIVNRYLGPSQAGIYMVAVQLSMGLVIVFDAMNKAFVPWIFKALAEDDKEKKKKIVFFTKIYFFILGLGGVLSFFIAPPLLIFIAGNKYIAATNIIGWLCLGQCFLGMYLMVTNYLFYTKETGKLAMVSLSSGIINVCLLFYFVPKFGLISAAISFAICMASRFIGTFYLVRRTKLMPWGKVF